MMFTLITLSIMAFSITTHSINIRKKPLSKITVSIMTLSTTIKEHNTLKKGFRIPKYSE
jgi:hypothetical protein